MISPRNLAFNFAILTLKFTKDIFMRVSINDDNHSNHK